MRNSLMAALVTLIVAAPSLAQTTDDLLPYPTTGLWATFKVGAQSFRSVITDRQATADAVVVNGKLNGKLGSESIFGTSSYEL